jgi:hypothetical protein
LTASNVSASSTLSASNVWFGNTMVYTETMQTGSITSPDLYFSSSAITGSDVMFKLEAGALTGSVVALQIIATGSQNSYAISASVGDIIGTNFSGSTFNSNVFSASNAFVSGTLFVNGQIVASVFSSSTIYVTSSNYVVGDNIITLNAASPALRYAGIEMYDSGSGNLSNFLWDSQNDYFFLSGSGTGINSKIIGGPDGQGDLTSGKLTKATFNNLIGDSIVTDNGSGIIVNGYVSASSFSGSMFGTSSWSTNSLTASYLTTANSYQITNLTASNISASGTGSFIRVGAGTSNPAAVLDVSSSTATTLFNVRGAGGNNMLVVSGSGNIGIGTSASGAYKLQVSGSFSATTKSFDIIHPSKPGKRLVYGSLESPYHGVRLTGKDKIINGKGKIILPDYINVLIDYDTSNVQITNIKHDRIIYVSNIDRENNTIEVSMKILKSNKNKEFEFYWTFTAVRKDVPALEVEI